MLDITPILEKLDELEDETTSGVVSELKETLTGVKTEYESQENLAKDLVENNKRLAEQAKKYWLKTATGGGETTKNTETEIPKPESFLKF